MLHYREFDSGLPGHPEKMLTPGVEFSSGRLGHIWAFCNGVAMANPGKAVVLLGSDGSQMEGDDAEAARLAVGKQLNIKVLVDDNNVTIAGHPQEYMAGYDLTRTLAGYGLSIETTMGEDLDALYVDLCRAYSPTRGRTRWSSSAPWLPASPGAEGSPNAHEVLEAGDRHQLSASSAAATSGRSSMLKAAKPDEEPAHLPRLVRRRQEPRRFRQDHQRDPRWHERRTSASPACKVFDNDLEGSCGLHHIRKKHPEVFVRGGIMERGNYSAAAGFGAGAGKQGIFATFSAFLEMCVSEITMARLNFSNVLAHFSHSGVDDMADNTCHFGINSMYRRRRTDARCTATDATRLYFPVDQHQFAACVKRIFNDPGCDSCSRTRAPCPTSSDKDGKPLYQGKPFEPGKDYIVREAPPGGGYVVAVGETVYRALDAVIELAGEGREGGTYQQADAERGGPGDDAAAGGRALRARRRGVERSHRARQPLRQLPAASRLQRPLRPHRHQPRRLPAACGSRWGIRASIPRESSRPCRHCSSPFLWPISLAHFSANRPLPARHSPPRPRLNPIAG